MKLKFVISILILWSLNIFSMTEDEALTVFKDANKAYQNEEWQAAIDQYNSIAEDYDSATLFANLGNAHFQLGEWGKSILFFKKSLKYKPNQKSVKHNLAAAIRQTKDNITPGSNAGLTDWGQRNLAIFGADNWAYTSIFFSILILIGFLLYLSSPIVWKKKLGVFTGIFSLLFALLCFWFSLSAKSHYLRITHGIVTSEVVIIREQPSESAPIAFKIHEGTDIIINETDTGWYHVTLNQDQDGWVKMNGIRGY